MRYPISAVSALCAGLVVLACSERGGTTPSSPRLNAASTVSATCSFTVMNALVAHYFSPSEAQVVRDLINEMQAATDTATRRNRGFDVMVHIASNVQAGNPDFQDASDLTNDLVACMFFRAAELPTTFPEDFTVATNPAQDGAYAVRGGSSDPSRDVVYSRAAGFARGFSGVTPPSGSTWPGILSGLPLPSRIVLYGRPGSNPSSYDWKVVPANAAFDPQVVVGLCVDASQDATSMLNEQSVGFLTFVDAGFLAAGVCSPIALGGHGGAPVFLAHGVVRGLKSLFAVRTAWAGTVLNPGGIGGSTGGIHSQFTTAAVQVTLTFVVQPSDTRVNDFIAPPVQVSATDATTGATVSGVQITLAAMNNNGVPAILNGTTTETTDNTGMAAFSDLSLTKTGGYLFVASGSVLGRGSIVVPSVNSTRFNVRP